MCNNCAESRKAAEKMASEMSSADKSREFYRRQGECRERERIIKLLETWGEDAGCFCCASDVAASEIIALIKGEN